MHLRSDIRPVRSNSSKIVVSVMIMVVTRSQLGAQLVILSFSTAIVDIKNVLDRTDPIRRSQMRPNRARKVFTLRALGATRT